MSDRIHDDEPDTGEPVVRALLDHEVPEWSHRPLEYLATSGTDNAMWRVRLDGEPDVVVRLPRRPGAAARVESEAATLHRLADIDLGATTPMVRHLGSPHDCFPHAWSVLEWIDGTDTWTDRRRLAERPTPELAADVARTVVALGEVPAGHESMRRPGDRGGPLGPLLDRLSGWLDDPAWNAGAFMDVAAVRRLAAAAAELIDEPVPTAFVHGDLIPGNLLVRGARLAAVIDWGGAGCGDPAQDLAPAWAVFGDADRSTFREAVGVDDAAWIRGRTFELEHAVGGVVYYVPRGHPLGDVMLRTLTRILGG